MPTIKILDAKGKAVRDFSFADNFLPEAPNTHLMHLHVVRQLRNKRAGTASTLNRDEVRGGGKKPWKQKGTGRARQGSTRAPHWRGGGVVFGPQPRSHAFLLPKKVRRAALRSALTRRLGEQALVVLDQLALPEAKTRHFKGFMNNFGFESLLLVVPTEDHAVRLASRNIPGVTVLPVAGLNVYDILRHRNIALTAPAIAPIVERLTR
jgi:large subunit ribosomal protein L4